MVSNTENITRCSMELTLKLVEWRCHLHKYPELSYKEANKNAYIQSILEA